MVSWHPCEGPPSERDDINREIWNLVNTVVGELDSIGESLLDDSEQPDEVMRIHEQLYALAREFHQRAMTDPRLPPEMWMEYKDHHYPEDPRRPQESYPVPQIKPGRPPERRDHKSDETDGRTTAT